MIVLSCYTFVGNILCHFASELTLARKIQPNQNERSETKKSKCQQRLQLKYMSTASGAHGNRTATWRISIFDGTPLGRDVGQFRQSWEPSSNETYISRRKIQGPALVPAFESNLIAGAASCCPKVNGSSGLTQSWGLHPHHAVDMCSPTMRKIGNEWKERKIPLTPLQGFSTLRASLAQNRHPVLDLSYEKGMLVG